MKAIYIGHFNKSPHFYTQIKGNNVKGYSKTIEVGDLLVFDTLLETRPLKVLEVSKRNYCGVFQNPNDAINAFFDAMVEPINDDEIKSLRENQDFKTNIQKQFI